MKKKELNELMDEYSEIPRSDDGNDLERWKKKKASETGKEKKENRFLAFFNNKYAFAGLTCVLVLAIVLPVIFTQILPKTPTAQPGKEQAVPVDDGKDREEQKPPKEDDPSTEEPKEEDTHYSSDFGMNQYSVSSVEEYNEKYNVAIRDIKTDEAFAVGFFDCRDKESDESAGFLAEVTIWGEEISDYKLSVELPGKNLVAMERFEDKKKYLPVIEIDETEYAIYCEEKAYGLTYMIYFVENNLNYSLRVNTEVEMELPDLLSAVFK